jgi:LPXTG-site transpeptidase (sortase) family protein
LKQTGEQKLYICNTNVDLKKTFISILNYLILAILIGAIMLTLSSDYIPVLRKRASEELSVAVKIEQSLGQRLIENAIDEALNRNKTIIEKKEPKLIFPHKTPFEIHIPSIDVKSNVYEGEFSKDSELEKLIILKELYTADERKLPLTFPGEEGTCVIAGHHLRSGKLFGALEHIKENDYIIITSFSPKVVLTYNVIDIIPYSDRYSPLETFIAKEGESRLILFTCSYRIGMPKTRFIVICELVDIEEKINEEDFQL